jgi:hypothetical protein
MGLTASTMLILIQGAVPWQRRAVATGLVQFSRTIGGAVGVGLMGGILTSFVGTVSSGILDPIARNGLNPADLASGRASLAAGLGVVYWILFAAAGAACAMAIRLMPDVRLGHEIEPAPGHAARPAQPPG